MTEAEPTGAFPISALGQWARDASDAHQVARSLAATEFVPEAMRNRPELVTASILTGHELGLEPMAALRSIDIVHGTPTLRAHAMRGLVQAAGHEIWPDEDCTDTRAIVYGRRHGSDIVHKSTWTMDRARKLDLANKDNYRKQPGAMLIARATAEVCRLTAADALLGMPYAAEEIDDGGESAAPKRKRTAQRKPLEQPEPEAPPLETAEPAEAVSDEPAAQ